MRYCGGLLDPLPAQAQQPFQGKIGYGFYGISLLLIFCVLIFCGISLLLVNFPWVSVVWSS